MLRPLGDRDASKYGNSDAGTAVEQARQHSWMDRAQKSLGGRGRDTEQGGRDECQNDGMVVHMIRIGATGRFANEHRFRSR